LGRVLLAVQTSKIADQMNDDPDTFDVNAPIQLLDRVSLRFDRIPPQIFNVVGFSADDALCAQRDPSGKIVIEKHPRIQLYRNIVYTRQDMELFTVYVKTVTGAWVKFGEYGTREAIPPHYVQYPAAITKNGKTLIWSDGEEWDISGAGVADLSVAHSEVQDPK
jgi:hypothetical protein